MKLAFREPTSRRDAAARLPGDSRAQLLPFPPSPLSPSDGDGEMSGLSTGERGAASLGWRDRGRVGECGRMRGGAVGKAAGIKRTTTTRRSGTLGEFLGVGWGEERRGEERGQSPRAPPSLSPPPRKLGSTLSGSAPERPSPVLNGAGKISGGRSVKDPHFSPARACPGD